jgi:hypothetical protein
VATYITFLAIIVIRIRLGHFPTRTKWLGFFGLLGLFQLWPAQAQQPTSAAVQFSRVIDNPASKLLDTGIDIYGYLAQMAKSRSDRNSCTLTYGTDSNDGIFEGYAFNATVTGLKCDDTTAIYEELITAVQGCADDLHNAHAVRGCCGFSHGGMWKGQLRLTADPEAFPAASVACWSPFRLSMSMGSRLELPWAGGGWARRESGSLSLVIWLAKQSASADTSSTSDPGEWEVRWVKRISHWTFGL